jgi:hypothetical protein
LTWWICVISNKSPKNWDLCKEHGLYGIAAYGRKVHQKISKGDGLLFWYARNGFLGYGTATEDSRPPTGPEEAPWGGGVNRFSTVIPFDVNFECPEPVFLRFISGKQEKTGIGAYTLQRGFAVLTQKSADEALKHIHSVHKKTVK